MPADPSDKLVAAWEDAIVAGPYVLESSTTQGAVEALRDLHEKSGDPRGVPLGAMQRARAVLDAYDAAGGQ